MIPGMLSTIDAKFTAPNTLEVITNNLPAFTLNLAGHPQYDASKPLKVTIDNQGVKTANSDMISFQKNAPVKKKGQEPGWANSKYETPATAKKPGMEGPVWAAMSDRHVYVYGTGGNPSKEELEKRRAVAEQAANWSMYRGEFLGRIMVFPRVLSDKEVRPSDFEATNLVLFGSKETNTLIDKYKDKAPLELNSSATETHGLIYVIPGDNGHYVVVNSGLPWWTTKKEGGFGFVPPPLQAMFGLKDYQLFQEGNENKIADGYFDNSWNTPEADKKALTASGVVTVKR
jgi:hypothetical protein